ncbi:MAG: hypothetical protein H6594_11205 [Flavobacteriales bacterium]|nr:hypothetical protein [Flavobacteriales bacterium]
MIDVVPMAGLCNRMRVIDSAIALSERLGWPVRVHWMPNTDLNCRFRDLFLRIEGVRIVEGMRRPSRLAFRFGKYHDLMEKVGRLLRTTYYYWDENERLEHDARHPEVLRQRRHAHIISYWQFLERADPFRGFVPLPHLQERIERIVNGFGASTIGVHIRRTDNAWSTETSPTHLFHQAMQREIDADANAMFFLATDSEEVKREMIQTYPDRVLTTPGPADRLSKVGMENGLVDLYCLSRSRKLLGSYKSSYSRTAAMLGRIEELTVRRTSASPIERP